jgi:hypothetical protein
MFDEHKEYKGEITIANILFVETSHDPKYKTGSVFDVHARVLEGGDADGMRVFVFDAKTPENAERWMRELCKATGVLELKSTAKEGFASHVSDKMVQARNNKRLPSNNPHPGGPTLLIQTARMSSEVDDNTADVSSTVDSQDDLGSPVHRGFRSDSFEGQSGPASGGRGINKRNGMGRGVFIKQGARIVGTGSKDGGTPSEHSDLLRGESYGDLYGDGVL